MEDDTVPPSSRTQKLLFCIQFSGVEDHHLVVDFRSAILITGHPPDAARQMLLSRD